MRVPKTINFGNGFKIRVKCDLSETDFNHAVDSTCDAAWMIADEPEDGDRVGTYVGTIYIRKSASKKRLLLMHELIHAVNDLYQIEVNKHVAM